MTKKKIFKITKQKTWTPEEDDILMDNVGLEKKKNWKSISSKLHNKTPHDCFSRTRKINAIFSKGKWHPHEDQRLLELVEKYGKSWCKISREMKTRSGKQIRDRYMNMLDENVNTDKFTLEEDIQIYGLQEKYGNKWAFFTKFLPQRPADKIKNRFNSSIKNKIKILSFIQTLDENKPLTRKSSHENLICEMQTSMSFHSDLIFEYEKANDVNDIYQLMSLN